MSDSSQLHDPLSPTNLDASVILCSYNGCDNLTSTLDTFKHLAIPDGRRWELIVVDNNSRDMTRETCERYTKILPLRYVFEPTQGLSHARNRGLRHAQGKLIAFTDNDVDVEPNWLASILAAADTATDAAFFGGRIIPRWAVPPPRWLERNSQVLLAGMAVHLDRGPTERYLEPGEWPFFGANMAFRRTVFDSGRQFRTDLGHTGGMLLPTEETEFMRTLISMDYKGFYVPSAVVHHRNPPDRMTERYLRRWFAGQGAATWRTNPQSNSHTLFGAPHKIWLDWMENSLRYAINRPWRGHRHWLPAEIAMATAWGIILESRRQSRHQRSKDRA